MMAHLTKGELKIMQVLWDHGELKPPEIQSHFRRPVKNVTLRSALWVLMDKGHVRRRKGGRAYYYRAVTPRARALKKMTQNMAEVFSGGSTLALIAQLIQSEKLSEADIRELRKIAGEKAPRISSSKGGKKR